MVHNVVMLTVQSTHGLGSRTSDVEDAGGQVFVADADLVGVPSIVLPFSRIVPVKRAR